jgi:hypothetical protein
MTDNPLPELPEPMLRAWREVSGAYSEDPIFSADQLRAFYLQGYEATLSKVAFALAQGADFLKGAGDREGDELVRYVREQIIGAING